jgi:uncharacterized protein (AIM24 family)
LSSTIQIGAYWSALAFTGRVQVGLQAQSGTDLVSGGGRSNIDRCEGAGAGAGASKGANTKVASTGNATAVVPGAFQNGHPDDAERWCAG